MPRKSATPPKFKTEAEEAEWLASPAGIRYSEQNFERASRDRMTIVNRGPVTRAVLARLAQLPKRDETLIPISIRLRAEDIQDAKDVAEETGTRYQQVLKTALRSGLDVMVRRIGKPAANKRAATKKRSGQTLKAGRGR